MMAVMIVVTALANNWTQGTLNELRVTFLQTFFASFKAASADGIDANAVAAATEAAPA